MAAVLDDGKLMLSGFVGDYWFDDGFSHSDVVLALAQIADDSDLTVFLNSGGGIATEGAAIHALLSRRSGTTDIVVDGIAASAASLIAMAGDTVTMSAGSIMMIHDPGVITIGTVADHEKSVEMLDALATSYARVYAQKSGKSDADCRTIMKAERWYSPAEAVSEGFADETSEDQAKPVAAFDYRTYAHAPKRLTALAQKKRWSLEEARKPAASAAPTRQPEEENPMTEKNKADEQTAVITAARSEAASEAKARIKAIVTHAEASGRETLADYLAYETEMVVDAAVAMLAKAPKASAETAEPEKEDGDDPDPAAFERQRMTARGQAQPGGKAPAKPATSINRGEIYASRRQQS